MGSRSSNATSQAVTTTNTVVNTTTNNNSWADNRVNNNSWADNRVTNTSNTNNWTDNSVTQVTYTDLGAIKEAAAITNNAIQANAAGLRVAADLVRDGQSSAFDFGREINQTAWDAINKAQTSNADIARLATSQVANAWENAKAAADGKNLGDLKPILLAMCAVFGVMMLAKVR
ncbi:hypothetical protein [Chitiniphilus eburneus]|uniref:hypothetical protein n=1 Tax=Chitiniphilus eburneus TaxID=2571148 RepID=UPI0035D1397E